MKYLLTILTIFTILPFGISQVVSIAIAEPFSFKDMRMIVDHNPSTSFEGLPEFTIQSYSQLPNASVPNPSAWIIEKYSTTVEEDIRRYNSQRQQSNQLIDAAVEAYEKTKIYYDFPNPHGVIQNRFEIAYTELSKMLTGERPMEITLAVSLVENAYDPSVTYKDLKNQVQNLAYLSTYVMDKKGLPRNDNLAKIMSIFQVLADTTSIEVPGEERSMTFYPLLYDFEDAWGRSDYSKMFVSKLLRNGTGNCTSLPRLFLMVAEEMNAEAYLAFAPQHTYVKIQDHFGEWHNVELTNQMFTTDDHIMEWGWVKSEAIRSGIYMTPISKKELIAQSMNELAMAHYKIFGNSRFTKKCVDLALKHNPKSITGYQIIANYYTELMKYIELQYVKKGKTAKEFRNDPRVVEIHAKMNAQYQLIDDLGFSEVPEKLYSEWIKSMNTETNHQESRNKMRKMLNSIQH